MACKEGQFDVVELMLNGQFNTLSINLNAQHVNGMTPFDLPYILCTIIRYCTDNLSASPFMLKIARCSALSKKLAESVIEILDETKRKN